MCVQQIATKCNTRKRCRRQSVAIHVPARMANGFREGAADGLKGSKVGQIRSHRCTLVYSTVVHCRSLDLFGTCVANLSCFAGRSVRKCPQMSALGKSANRGWAGREAYPTSTGWQEMSGFVMLGKRCSRWIAESPCRSAAAGLLPYNPRTH